MPAPLSYITSSGCSWSCCTQLHNKTVRLYANVTLSYLIIVPDCTHTHGYLLLVRRAGVKVVSGSLSNRGPQDVGHMQPGRPFAPHPDSVPSPSSPVSTVTSHVTAAEGVQTVLFHRRVLGQQSCLSVTHTVCLKQIQLHSHHYPRTPSQGSHTRCGTSSRQHHDPVLFPSGGAHRHPATSTSASSPTLLLTFYGALLTCLQAATITHLRHSSTLLYRSTIPCLNST